MDCTIYKGRERGETPPPPPGTHLACVVAHARFAGQMMAVNERTSHISSVTETAQVSAVA